MRTTNSKQPKAIKMKVTLPVSGSEYTLRSPKGRDLRVVAKSVKEGQSSFDALYIVITCLAEPVLTEADLDDMDAQDVTELIQGVKSFPVFSAPIQ